MVETHPEQRDPSGNPGGKGGRGEILRWPRVISVGSGKGGVGKTNVVANLAFAFTRIGKKVLVFDADPPYLTQTSHIIFGVMDTPPTLQ